MSTRIRIMTTLTICLACGMLSQAGQADDVNSPDDGREAAVTVELTKLEVTDTSLEFTYKIRNHSDHDVWVCSEVSSAPFELFLTYDTQTLLIRKRLDVPCHAIWARPPAPGRYIRLGPGEDRQDTLRIDLPVTPRFMYASQGMEMVTRTVRRLLLEIGYYDEDLPALIRRILEVADQFNPQAWSLHPDVRETYFRGLSVRSALLGFDLIEKDPYAEGHVYLYYSRQALTGEKTLGMEINGIAIPYSGPIEKEVAP